MHKPIRRLIKTPNRDLIKRQCQVSRQIDRELFPGYIATIPAGAICEIASTWQGKFKLAYTQRLPNGTRTTFTTWMPRNSFRLLSPEEERPEARLPNPCTSEMVLPDLAR